MKFVYRGDSFWNDVHAFDLCYRILNCVSQNADLGYQATQRIIRASEPLKLMQEINQNFPNLVSSLSRMQVWMHQLSF